MTTQTKTPDKAEAERARAEQARVEREAAQAVEAKRTEFVEARDRFFLAAEALGKAPTDAATDEDRELIRTVVEELKPLTRKRAGGGSTGLGIGELVRSRLLAGDAPAEIERLMRERFPGTPAGQQPARQLRAHVANEVRQRRLTTEQVSAWKQRHAKAEQPKPAPKADARSPGGKKPAAKKLQLTSRRKMPKKPGRATRANSSPAAEATA